MNSPTVGKVEDNQAGGDRSSNSSLASTPEHEQEEALLEQDLLPHNQEQQQQQKRKGGRKPIYATSEERKQRNRQAQAAFRERRTEYIKQLESTIKLHEETLQNLQQSHRSAADECLMLRYKNSLLERVLVEKGIDVQAELQRKGGSPNLGPTRMPVPPPASQPIQRYAVNKFAAQNRRSLTGMPKPDGPAQNQPVHISPHLQPTTTSHMSSPATSTTKSPNFLPQNGPMSPSFGPVGQQTPHMRPQPPLRPSQFNTPQQRPVAVPPSSYPSSTSSGNGLSVNTAAGAGARSYYPVQYQDHYDQLEQEYDAQADMIDQDDPSEASAPPGPFPPPFANGSMPQGIPPQQQQHPPHMASNGTSQPLQPQPPPGQAPDANGNFNGVMNGLFDPYDPMLDADPFGLSASMHFPTQFQFDAPTR